MSVTSTSHPRSRAAAAQSSGELTARQPRSPQSLPPWIPEDPVSPPQWVGPAGAQSGFDPACAGPGSARSSRDDPGWRSGQDRGNKGFICLEAATENCRGGPVTFWGPSKDKDRRGGREGRRSGPAGACTLPKTRRQKRPPRPGLASASGLQWRLASDPLTASPVGPVRKGSKDSCVHGPYTPLVASAQRHSALSPAKVQRKEKSGFVPNHQKLHRDCPWQINVFKISEIENASMLFEPHGKLRGPKFLFEHGW